MLNIYCMPRKLPSLVIPRSKVQRLSLRADVPAKRCVVAPNGQLAKAKKLCIKNNNMPGESIIPATINPDLQKERNNASFSVEEFATWYHGGAEKLKFKRDLQQYLFKDITEDSHKIHYETHEENYSTALKQSIGLVQKLRKLQKERNPGGTDYWPTLCSSPFVWGAMSAGNPFGVQMSMMVDAIKKQGTDEQYERFGKRAANLEVAGTYAQTELGHGTFLRGLETRADFDRKTDEFVLNSPTLTAYKWWPGGLGHTANYCLVVAQLYIDGKPQGVQMFYVQIRDEETHMPLPGIDVGEIGKKMGFYGVNNGYLGLKNVRIPRTSMLMRNAQVLRDGTFVKSPASVLTYFTMVLMRCFITHSTANMHAIAATIATRYSAVRRQSPINPNEPEPQIIDHVTQQMKLFPEIATSIAFRLAANYLRGLYNQTTVEIERGEYARLPEMHALSCAMKVLASYDASAGIERLRLGCGGHGYLHSSNLGPLYANATAACTYEGENTVLLLQVGRFLIKSWRAAVAGQALAPTVTYLSKTMRKNQFGYWTGTWENIVDAMQYVAAGKIRLAFESMSERIKSGQTEAEAANHTGIELTQAAELHGRAFVCATFLEQVHGPSSRERSSALNKVLENLLELYLVHTVLRHMADVLRFIKLADTDLRALQTRLEQVLKKIRPDAVAIVDGFDFRDHDLNSTLGAYDGNVYERLFAAAKKSPLNKEPVPKAFHELLKPFLKSNL